MSQIPIFTLAGCGVIAGAACIIGAVVTQHVGLGLAGAYLLCNSVLLCGYVDVD